MSRRAGDKDAEPAPWLLCLNLRREYVTVGRPLYAAGGAAATERARALLYVARECGWTVAHVQTRRRALADSEFAAPVAGLEPLPSEPLFIIRQRSALAHLDLRARLSAERPKVVYLIGFAFAHEGLATVFDAVDLGVNIRVVEDAIASPAIGDRSGAEIDRAALAIAASLSAIANSSEVMGAGADTVVSFKGA